MGERLGRGESLAAILASSTAVAEGVTTAKSVFDRIHPLGIHMPIATSVYRVLYEGLAPREGVIELLSRESGSERV
mgnify:CR=1 FL=1